MYNRARVRGRFLTSAWRRKAGSFRLCVWPWPVSHYISQRTAAASASKSRRRGGRTSAERFGRVGWRRVNTQTRSDPSSMQLCNLMGCAARIFFPFLFSPASRSGNKSLFEGRTLEGCRRMTRQTKALSIIAKNIIFGHFIHLNNMVIGIIIPKKQNHKIIYEII